MKEPDNIKDMTRSYFLKPVLWIRLILTGLVIYWVYNEAGPAITTFTVLVAVHIEGANFLHKLHITTSSLLAESLKIVVGDIKSNREK